MENKIRITENLLLKILADQSGMGRKEIAKALQITPQWLATLLNSDEKLSEEIKERASNLFKVSTDYFNSLNIESAISIVSDPPPPEYRTGATWQDIAEQEGKMRAEIARLKEENRQLLLRLTEKEGYIADKQATIEELFALLRNRKKDE